MNPHHIPEVNDDRLERLIDQAKSPVAVLFQGGEVQRQRDAMWSFRAAAEALDRRIIFVWIRAEENPTITRDRAVFWDHLPTLTIFRHGMSVRSRPLTMGSIILCTLREPLDEALADHMRETGELQE